jgi:hypothetical protein
VSKLKKQVREHCKKRAGVVLLVSKKREGRRSVSVAASASLSPFEVLRQLKGIGTKGGGHWWLTSSTNVGVKRLKPILF